MRINDTHYRSSAARLLWAAFFVAVMLVSAINYILIFSDRIENNPYRTKDALLTMLCWLPILTIVLTIESMLIFALPVLSWKHEFTIKQYFMALAFQTPISIFSFFFIEADCRHSSRMPLLFSTLAAAMIVGVMCGYNLGR